MFRKLCILFLSLFLSLAMFSCNSKVRPDSKIDKFYNYPNPFNSREEHTTYKVTLSDGDTVSAKVHIYSSDGVAITSFDLKVDEAVGKKVAVATWTGTDENGNYLPAYVYDAIVKVEDEKGNIFISTTKTVLR